MIFRELCSRRWRWATVLVVVGMAFLTRLGFWQLDRLQQRRAENARIVAQLAQGPLQLDGSRQWDDPTALNDRAVSAQGTFDFANQIVLKNQNWQGQPGMHLVTPLVLETTGPGGRPVAVLVDRGWIPYDRSARQFWSEYDQTPVANVIGMARKTQLVRGQSIAPPAPQEQWFRVDIDAIARQMAYTLLPFYLLQAPDPRGIQTLPYRDTVELDLSEGSHLSYALQWFIFALMFGIGYIYYVRKQGDRIPTREAQTTPTGDEPMAGNPGSAR